MADNRMFLIHKPTGLGVMLGKRTGYGWSDAPANEELNRLYDYLADMGAEGEDDFMLAIESNDGWNYTNKTVNGFRVFEID